MRIFASSEFDVIAGIAQEVGTQISACSIGKDEPLYAMSFRAARVARYGGNSIFCS
jgi:hypothetical protein